MSQSDHVDPMFDFFNSKNLINSAKNATGGESSLDEERDREMNNDVTGNKRFADDSMDYQQDQSAESEEKIEEEDEDIKDNIVVTDDESGPMASQKTPTESKRHLPLYPDPHFYNIPVNINHSAVHVPSNVYDRSKEVIKGIKWSESLDNIFKSNYEGDPTLSWQYFGSSTGFMRQYPAMIWSQEPIDLFDCRTRSWYIEAASSPKDVVILVDRSGSMTGMRREIARHVVNNILDTLGNNDYVNIFTFSNTTDPTIECFDEMLVQANLANIRVLKESMSTFRTEQIANFSLALTTAFQLLQNYRENASGAQCNQAIMLITDGVQYNYKEIFEKYNWQNRPFMPVRVFTYLIGSEVSDVREVKWMACANQGYYVHLSTYAEVREEVLQYIPVMARPMVLNPKQRPVPTWSPVYADVTDPKLTNWLWITRERNSQRERFLMYRRSKTFLRPDDQDKQYVHQQKHKQDNYGELQNYRLMTSVSLPVYDLKPNATRVANLLGVAGTDVPIEYIQRLMMHHRFQGILKPAYNRVDVTEIEVMDDDSDPRDFSDEIKELRRNIVMQNTGKTSLNVKLHLDNMKRIMTGKRHYYYQAINNTPFSLVITFPDKYGFYRAQTPVEFDIHRMRPSLNISLLPGKIFQGNWTIHPEWNYCSLGKSMYKNDKEEIFRAFTKIEKPGWKWNQCDRKLMCALVADANITNWFSKEIRNTKNEENKREFIKRFGITIVFIATQSGLTRWLDLPQDNEDPIHKERPKFHEIHNRATDEIWYRRAVEQHYIDPRSFVYSVPFDVDEEDENHTLVTASHAIFRDDGIKHAPVAVVGFQFYYSALYTQFVNTVSHCGDINCKRTCDSSELFCVVLDDNGYVIVTYNRAPRPRIGSFFGDFRPDIMRQLVDEGIYRPHRMYDYQGTCFPRIATNNPASKYRTPFKHLVEIWKWSVAMLFTMVRTVWGNDMDYPEHDTDENYSDGDNSYNRDGDFKEFDSRLLINKTKPDPCDTEMWLYTLLHYTEKNITSSGYNRSMSENCSRPFLIQPVTGSNLVLLVINMICPEKKLYSISSDILIDDYEEPKTPTPVEIYYNISLSCYKVKNNDFPRRPYMSCINRSIHEQEIRLCGRSSTISNTLFLLFLTQLLLADF
ncbi:voltage-dependent calcium channel subunit alpha-2/delta-related [Holotrichia oblita]|uniref:Voltage-dependent calcium channel subunit alpha-2/delta-related n=1 Tax=Holotrichia oblita TaxID=644536 RepID=A0ACB9SJ74_HOLOL|nr:voltage-dependent calcium channel subunit alpha-2/delta-related [Holotrichia oblita]